jgi:coenzyme F420 hydrogenase subunit delta
MLMEEEPTYLDMDKLVFGCGNVLFGDDAFGPVVVDYLNQHYSLPEDCMALNVKTSIRGLLFNIVLNERKPNLILIIDAVDKGKNPGEIFEIDLNEIPEKKLDDFSMHQMPSSNLLKELKDNSGIDIRILVTQVQHIPTEVEQGLSDAMKAAIDPMCERIVQVLGEYGVEVEKRVSESK